MRWLHTLGDPGANRVRVAAVQSDRPVRIELELEHEPTPKPGSAFLVRDEGSLELKPQQVGEKTTRYYFDVPPPADPARDDAVTFLVSGPGLPDVRVELRRSVCEIETALLGGYDLLPETRAALLWYAWNRCTRLVGIKRFGSGLSGSDVIVFRPRLTAPTTTAGRSFDPDDFVSCAEPSMLGETWGSWLLVKTGRLAGVRQEWARGRMFLRDRLTPFTVRAEEYLRVAHSPTPKRATTPAEPRRERATLVSSFLGGDLVRAEQLEHVIRCCRDVDASRAAITRTFQTLRPWHEDGTVGKLRQYPRFFGRRGGPLCLFNKYDFREHADRRRYSRNAAWDVAFRRSEHLFTHLWGEKQNGLLFKLAEIDVRFSLTHGDMNPRNVLWDAGYAWLIDFEHAGVAPTVHDFAWLEANLRCYCLALNPAGGNLDAAATQFEQLLLDYFHGGETSLEPVRGLAADMGADPDELTKFAAVVAHVRREARQFCLDKYPDHRDYLAVLYLCVLSILRGDRTPSQPPANLRLLVRLSWVLEEQLSRLCGLKPYDSGWRAPDPRRAIGRDWLGPDGAPGRVDTFVRGADGSRGLAPLAAARGVLEGPYHHLDVYEHTLLVLAYVEELLRCGDPLEGFLRPGEIDRRVAARLAEQGLRFNPPLVAAAETVDPAPLGAWHLDAARECLKSALDESGAKLLLKWCALLHDLGKPGVRQMDKDGGFHFFGHPEYGVQLLREHIDLWFGTGAEADRLRNLILRHHDHNNLAKTDGLVARRFADLAAFVDNPKALPPNFTGRPVDYFDGFRQAVSAVLCKQSDPDAEEDGGLRDDLPLLVLHGMADSLASRGLMCPVSLADRARLYLLVLAVWHRREELLALQDCRQKCADGVTEKHNPALHGILDGLAVAAKASGSGSPNVIWSRRRALEDWAWEQARATGTAPSPADVLAEYHRRTW